MNTSPFVPMVYEAERRVPALGQVFHARVVMDRAAFCRLVQDYAMVHGRGLRAIQKAWEYVNEIAEKGLTAAIDRDVAEAQKAGTLLSIEAQRQSIEAAERWALAYEPSLYWQRQRNRYYAFDLT